MPWLLPTYQSRYAEACEAALSRRVPSIAQQQLRSACNVVKTIPLVGSHLFDAVQDAAASAFALLSCFVLTECSLEVSMEYGGLNHSGSSCHS